jgi:hypothetical protein
MADALRRLLRRLLQGSPPTGLDLVDIARPADGGQGDHSTHAWAERQAEQHAALRRIAAEAVILQDQAEEVLRRVRARDALGEVAPSAGPLVHRFFRLRDRLPERCEDPGDERLRATLSVILHHHAMLVATSLDLLAYEWRSERVTRWVEGLDGLGEPGRRLDDVYRLLAQTD